MAEGHSGDQRAGDRCTDPVVVPDPGRHRQCGSRWASRSSDPTLRPADTGPTSTTTAERRPRNDDRLRAHRARRRLDLDTPGHLRHSDLQPRRPYPYRPPRNQRRRIDLGVLHEGDPAQDVLRQTTRQPDGRLGSGPRREGPSKRARCRCPPDQMRGRDTQQRRCGMGEHGSERRLEAQKKDLSLQWLEAGGLAT